MTEREMLEFAATAAGIDYTISQHGNLLAHKHPLGGEMIVWNPIIDDGDALRLAVKLGIGVECRKHVVVTTFNVDHPGIGVAPHRRTDDITGDKNDATRLAIVRAAAEIGKAMP